MRTSPASPPAGSGPAAFEPVAAGACGACVVRPGPPCRDCLGTYFVDDAVGDAPLVLSPDEALAVQRLVRAGLIPQPRHRVAA